MSIASIGGAAATGASGSDSLTNAMKGTGALDKQAFLQLLVTQLKGQSPLDPVSNEDFVAQLAQFSSLESAQGTDEKLGKILELTQLGQGASLVGRKVTYLDPESGEQLPGIVSAVENRADGIFVDVGGTEVPLSYIFRVDAASAESIA